MILKAMMRINNTIILLFLPISLSVLTTKFEVGGVVIHLKIGSKGFMQDPKVSKRWDASPSNGAAVSIILTASQCFLSGDSYV